MLVCSDSQSSTTALPARMLHLVLASVSMHGAGGNLTMLVVGDSWGSFGPSWHEMQDMFDRHAVSATVKSVARGGTTACQWAEDANILVKAAQQEFPETLPGGPDYMWYTLGGNDLVDKSYLKCSEQARSFDDQLECMRNITATIVACATKMLDAYTAKFPKSKIVQCGYDIPCLTGSCAQQPRDPFCTGNITCQNLATQYWQGPLMDPLKARYPQQYTGLNILGAGQAAGKIPGASAGHPIMDRDTPCALMSSCVHPTYGKAAATAVGEAFWDLYFRHQLQNVGERTHEPASAIVSDCETDCDCTTGHCVAGACHLGANQFRFVPNAPFPPSPSCRISGSLGAHGCFHILGRAAMTNAAVSGHDDFHAEKQCLGPGEILVRMQDSYASFYVNVSISSGLGYCVFKPSINAGTAALQFTRSEGLACSLHSMGLVTREGDAPVFLYTLNATVSPGAHCDTVSSCPQPFQPGHFPSCFIGQKFGPGYVSFDECSGAAGSFACALQDNGCTLDVCGGAHSHAGCTCSNCELRPGKTSAQQQHDRATAEDSLLYDCHCDSSGCSCDAKL